MRAIMMWHSVSYFIIEYLGQSPDLVIGEYDGTQCVSAVVQKWVGVVVVGYWQDMGNILLLNLSDWSRDIWNHTSQPFIL